MVYELLGTIGTGELQLEGKALGEIVAAPIL
jgi:hypothetical protein